jgi:hypothetical protein
MATPRLDVMIDGVKYPTEYNPLGGKVGATGYGNKLRSGRMVRFAGKLRNIWVRQYSNAGTAYIIVKGQEVIVH